MGTYKCPLPFCECSWGGGSICRWWGHLTTMYCNQTFCAHRWWGPKNLVQNCPCTPHTHRNPLHHWYPSHQPLHPSHPLHQPYNVIRLFRSQVVGTWKPILELLLHPSHPSHPSHQPLHPLHQHCNWPFCAHRGWEPKNLV